MVELVYDVAGYELAFRRPLLWSQRSAGAGMVLLLSL